MAYLTQTDLENALGVQTVLAIYDDDHDQVVDSAPIDACLDYASEECDSFLRGNYAITYPITPVPAALKYAALDFACAYTMRRRPDIVRAMGEESWTTFRDSALEKIKRYVEAMQRMPPTTGTPTNVGGEVMKAADEADEVDPPTGSRWEDMGDF